ncbi:SusC/RagA family TonB-linked outer membrane protein [Alistipes communis]|uniref:SusC/RagA family TonB-linked outer membrane protein n=1 Tax=Alistipes communis TaxID=2585118 RepID=UPI0002EFA09B|nr:SusC/RagA family TonB-linked outer membrane protein [Alistipes communis]
MNKKQVFRKIEGLIGRVVLCVCLSVCTLAARAQDNLLTVNLDKVPLSEAIAAIEGQSRYLFMLGEGIDASAEFISVHAEKQPLREVLDQLIRGSRLAYSIEGQNILLSLTGTDTDKPFTVRGRVSDRTGAPVIGAAVLVKGTTIGTSTGLDGSYTLEIPAPAATAVLTVNFLGYAPMEILVGQRSQIDFALREEAQTVDAVVVTALGIKRSEKALSYNVQQVNSEDIVGNKDANFINSLNGKVAGVNINASSSGVGGASKVVMRGSKAISQSSNALYVIDGIPMFNLGSEGGTEFDSRGTTEAIADINPEDIESISVLTGAAAAALYGNNAANGAIVITTKKGKAGALSVTVSQNTEFLRPFRMPEFQSRYGTGSLASSASSVDKSWGARLNAATIGGGYDPADDFLQTGVVTTETVALSTGTEKNQTYVSASAVNSKGMVPNNDYDRYNFTFRNTTSFLKDRMTLDVGASYIKQSDMNMVNQGTYSNPLVTAYLFPRGNDWEDIRMYERWDSDRKLATQYWPEKMFSALTGQNPYWIAYRNLRENKKDRYMLNANLNYRILDWLSVSGRVRIDNSNNEYTKKLYATSNTTLTNEGSDALSKGSFMLERTIDKQTYADILVNINKTFGENWSLNANIGTSYSDMQQSIFSNEGPIMSTGIANVFNVMQLDNTKTKRIQSGYRDQTQSLFASVEAGFKNTYFLTLTGRGDWPSQLAGPYSAKTAFFYPSVGASVVLSEALPMPKWISYLKVRGSFASVGLPIPRFLAQQTYEWDNANQQWASKTHYPMGELKPERTDSWEVGLTARFLRHFNVDLSLYTAKTYNQTFDPGISPSSGYSTMYIQTGSVRNKGIELSAGYSNEWGKFGWSSNFTFSANRNEIMELMEGYVIPVINEPMTLDRLDIGGLGYARFLLKKGGSLGDLYSTADLRRDSRGNIYVDADGKVVGNTTNVKDIKLGSVFPKANLAWRNDFNYGNFNFGFMLSARLGGIVYSATQAYMDYYGVSEATAAARDFGGVVVNGDLIDAENWYSVVAGQGGLPQYYTYSATNFRLQEVSIGYTIPKAKLWNIADVTVSLVGRNLWMIYCEAPFDPEAVATTGNYYQGIDNFMMPGTRNLGFNVRLKF